MPGVASYAPHRQSQGSCLAQVNMNHKLFLEDSKLSEPEQNNTDGGAPEQPQGGRADHKSDQKSPHPDSANDGSVRSSPHEDTAAGPEVDLAGILGGWPVGGNRPTVRMIRTATGERAIQVRLELGLLQFALTGRPDGRRPHGADSLLDWHLGRIEAHRLRTGGEDGIQITSKECASLRDEGVQVYHRYVALFALEEYEAVVRDTGRNLRMFDLCRDFGASQGDRTVLEQFRPFVVMMRARAEAAIGLAGGDARRALLAVERALAELRSHFDDHGPMGGFDQSSEVTLLRGMRDALVPRLPTSQRSELEERLRRAVDAENFELAAILRDELRALEY